MERKRGLTGGLARATAQRPWRVLGVWLLLLVGAFMLAGNLQTSDDGGVQPTLITAPMIFVATGIALGPEALDLLDLEIDEGAVRVLAEATLVLVLFTDAIRIDVMRLRHQIELPARLLAGGLPMTVGLGTLAGLFLFADFGLWDAALLAAILAPTDAALGQAVVSNPRVPVHIRQALNVESGLNDGLMLPAITILLALAAAGMDLETPGYWATFALEQVGFGILVGAVAGALGGRLIDWFASRGWIEGGFRQLATLAVGVFAFALAEAVGGNGFVAAFIAGLAFGSAARQHCTGAYDFAEDEGQLLALLTFLFFGIALAGPALNDLTPRIAIYVLLSRTVIRMLPVALVMLGAGLRPPTLGYLGWFGPRGLASILFALFVLEDAALPIADDLLLVVTWTVLASVVLHGATSVLLAERYADWWHRHNADPMPENTEVQMMPTRGPAPSALEDAPSQQSR